MILSCFVLLLYTHGSLQYGYASGGDQTTCGRPYRSGRMYQPPCDLKKHGYCTSAGKTYPWNAVKRFIKDNQGLMRRMYGDQRHIQVLKAELGNGPEFVEKKMRFARYQHGDDADNEVFPPEEDDESEARFLREDMSNDDVLKTKFIYSEEPIISIKLAGLKTAPHFRPTSERTTTKVSATEKESDVGSTVTTELPDISTTDSGTDQTTNSKLNDTERVDDSEDDSSSNEEVAEPEKTTAGGEKEKMETVLFQDMVEEPLKKKVHLNYNSKGVNACPVREEVVAPFWANNTRGEELALLNMYPFEQYVHLEKCAYEHRQMYCRDGCRCEQQYRLHRLLAYDPNNECRGIFSDWFRFPSCCVCICYDMPVEFRVTSRSPRYQSNFN
nr:protein spaetzle 4 [Leptinotarsa decemlineata]